MIDLSGQVVIVTGASGGIGGTICRVFTTAGARVVGTYRFTPPADQDPDLFLAVQAELTDTVAPDLVVSRSIERFGRIDGLINGAASQDLVSLDAMTGARWQQMIDTNMTAVHRLTAAALPALIESRGSIVHIASIEGSTPAPMHAHYAVTKAALIMHAKAVALEYGVRGVRANSISPGLIGRDGIERDWPEGVQRWQNNAPLGRLGTPTDVANACLFLCSPLASWITGIDLVVDGGVSTNPHW